MAQFLETVVVAGTGEPACQKCRRCARRANFATCDEWCAGAAKRENARAGDRTAEHTGRNSMSTRGCEIVVCSSKNLLTTVLGRYLGRYLEKLQDDKIAGIG